MGLDKSRQWTNVLLGYIEQCNLQFSMKIQERMGDMKLGYIIAIAKWNQRFLLSPFLQCRYFVRVKNMLFFLHSNDIKKKIVSTCIFNRTILVFVIVQMLLYLFQFFVYFSLQIYCLHILPSRFFHISNFVFLRQFYIHISNAYSNKCHITIVLKVYPCI